MLMTGCSGETKLSCTYLAHHEVENKLLVTKLMTSVMVLLVCQTWQEKDTQVLMLVKSCLGMTVQLACASSSL